MTLISDNYRNIGLFVESPSDILRLGEVSRFFHGTVRDIAIQAFFKRNAQTIQEIGYHPISDQPFQNFRHLYRLIAFRCINDDLQYDKLPLSLTDYRARSQQPIICRSTMDKMFAVQWKITKIATEDFNNFFSDVLSELPEAKQLSCYNTQSDEFIECSRLLFFIPFQITTFQNLEVITLSDHHITLVPSFLSQLKSLEDLTLDRNRIHDVECPFSEMPALKWINLSQNLLTELPRAALFSQTHPLAIQVDLDVALRSSDSLEHYPCVLIDFYCDALPDFQSKEKIGKIYSHNIAFLKRFIGVDKMTIQEMNVQKILDDCNQEELLKQIQNIRKDIILQWELG